MAQLTFTKGSLDDIATNYGEPYLPGSEVSFIDGSFTKTAPNINDGALRFALKRDSHPTEIKIDETHSIFYGNDRAYIFLDEIYNDGQNPARNIRYAVTGPVDWSEILNMPNVASSISLSNKKLSLVDANSFEFSNVDLPFLYSNGDTLTGPLLLSGGDSNSSGKIMLDNAICGQITNNGTSTLFGFTTPNTDILTVGHIQYNLNLRTKAAARVIDSALVIQNSKPKVTVTGNNSQSHIIAYLDDVVYGAQTDGASNNIQDTYIANASLDEHTLIFNKSTNQEHSDITLPFVLLSGDTMTGPLTIAHDDTITSPRVSLDYNNTTQSLDFTFT